jgi:DNA-directed RNA polymerase subunit RPC12/RpoP
MGEESGLEIILYKYKCAKCGFEWEREIPKHMGSSAECPKCGVFNPPVARRYAFEKEFTSFRK